jgi:hypothetical protein
MQGVVCVARLCALRDVDRALQLQVKECAEHLAGLLPHLSHEEVDALASFPGAEGLFAPAAKGAPPRAAAAPGRPAAAPPSVHAADLPLLVAEILDAHDPAISPRPASGPWRCWTCNGEVAGHREVHCLRCRAQKKAPAVPKMKDPDHE